MYLKLIACEVFTREVCHCVARTPHVVDLEFTEKGAHDQSDYLRGLIQAKIDVADSGAREYDAILLGYGLCGNSVVDLVARKTPLVIPRAHDCCTIFLGSREKFKEHFADNPSCPFSSVGYAERTDSYVHEASLRTFIGLDKTFEEYVEKYGEENARYIYETLHPPARDTKIAFIEMPETKHLGYAARIREQAVSEGKELVELQGDKRLIEDLLFGRWGEEDFLAVEPGLSVGAVYDWIEIVRAREVCEADLEV